MKKVYLMAFALLFFLQISRAQQAITDGPYIWYRGGQAVIKSVYDQNGKYTVDSGKLTLAKAKQQFFTVRLDKHPEWDFTVKLKTVNASRPSVSRSARHMLVLSDMEGEFEPFRN